MRKLLILLLIPSFLFSQFYEENDKQLHFAAGSIIGASGYVWSYQKHQDKKRAMVTGICLAFAAGVVKEMYDGQIKGGYVELEDIAATTLGGITWSLTIPLFQPTRRATKIKQSRKKRRPKSNKKCWCPKS
tara:strand:- start:96 stop:488 length:393 start_codon:yes stop_codon:yes gene_type:complete